MSLVKDVMWNESDDVSNKGAAYVVYVAMNVLFVVTAAAFTQWAPMAANSGIPPIKSFLNGTLVKGGILEGRTLIAKVIGITLIVACNLPLGREGPFVHIGAMISALMTHYSWPGTKDLLELRLPQLQREWVGMGAAAGVAAAFNAPFGGILYSFEEVCSYWTENMTWRSFSCVVVVGLTYSFFVEMSNGELQVRRGRGSSPRDRASVPSCFSQPCVANPPQLRPNANAPAPTPHANAPRQRSVRTPPRWGSS